jgi:hypothetical protein
MPDVLEGIALFQAGDFWESHEAWERAWILLPRGQAKIMLQAMIQIAACAVLLQEKRLKGFHRKMAQVKFKLEGFVALGIQGIPPFSVEGGLTFLDALSSFQALEANTQKQAIQSAFKQVLYA